MIASTAHKRNGEHTRACLITNASTGNTSQKHANTAHADTAAMSMMNLSLAIGDGVGGLAQEGVIACIVCVVNVFYCVISFFYFLLLLCNEHSTGVAPLHLSALFLTLTNNGSTDSLFSVDYDFDHMTYCICRHKDGLNRN